MPVSHGHSRRGAVSGEYRSWHAMLTRCNNPKYPRYADHGGRGIKVCKRWQGPGGFKRFIADMGPKPSKSHSLDRKDNNKGYCKSNCRWATRIEQGRNTRANKYATVDGVTKLLVVWLEELGLSWWAYHRRLKYGWTLERALTQPVQLHRKRQGSQACVSSLPAPVVSSAAIWSSG